jgi:BirA family transcriptional regulator, biotin operon repressor / biotin---[acetyl-CoA-carboxylase] ligase
MFNSQDETTLNGIAHALSRHTQMAVSIVASTHSTNQVLLNEAVSLTAQPTVLLAMSQTAGRGRRGRVWHSGAVQTSLGHAFLGSLGVLSRASLAQLSVLPLYVGVAVARCVQGWGVPARVKWPNDVWVDDAKLAGVLVETASVFIDAAAQPSTAVVIGLGLNWTAAPQLPDKQTLCVADCLATRPDPEQAARDLIVSLHHAYLDCTARAPLKFAAFDALLGRYISTDNGLQGRAVGINAAGHLGLQNAQGTHWLHSGEVSIQVQS